MQKEWYSAQELADWLGIDRTAVYWMIYKRTGPSYYKIAGKLRFRRVAIETWLASQAEG